MKRIGLTNVINVTHIKQQELAFSLMDHYLTTNEELYATAGALPTNASDHFFVYTSRKKPKTKHHKSKFKGRAYSRLDEDKFREDIARINWQEIIDDQDCNLAWEQFQQKKSLTPDDIHSHELALSI